jgi:hypothetical protein
VILLRTHRVRLAQSLAIGAALVLALPSQPLAHEIPATVSVLAFVKPEAHWLRVLARVPLEALRDMEFPLRTSGEGYLDIPRTEALLPDAAKLWLADYIAVYENDRRLDGGQIVATRLSLPSDRSFGSYDSAMAHVRGAPLSAGTDLLWKQSMLDVLIEYPIQSDRSRFSIDPALAHLGVQTTSVLRFLPPGGAERAFQYIGNPGLVRLDPRWHQSALRFVSLGFHHILDGMDHLLFVFCLLIPFRKLRPLIAIVTSFTVAHSITLIAAASGWAPGALWFPPLIEVLIALSIVYMALENIMGPRLEKRWLVAFGFGLVHGFGFSFALRESLQFAGSHLLTSLLSFNIGVELGQLFVLALTVPALAFFFRRATAERAGTIVLSALVAHSAWHWMTDRWSVLRQYRFQWPAFDLVLLAGMARALMLLLIAVGAAWVLSGVFGRLAKPAPQREVGAD